MSSRMSGAPPAISIGGSGGVRHRAERVNGTGYASSSRLNGSSSTPSTPSRKGKERARGNGSGAGHSAKRTRRALVRELFRRFGEHCARNQIRTLLIDCLVMTNLFYPSLTLYLRKRYPPLHPPASPSHNAHRLSPISGKRIKEHPLSLLSTPILDSFFPHPRALLDRVPWSGWWDSSNSETWHAQRLEKGDRVDERYPEELRVMRVGWADVGDVLNRDGDAERAWIEQDFELVRIVREMVEDWERQDIHGSRCVRRLSTSSDRNNLATPSGECYIWTSHEKPPWSLPPGAHGNMTVAAADWDLHPDDIPYHGVSAVFSVPRQSIGAFDLRWGETLSEAAKRVEGEVFVEASGSSGYSAERTGEFMLSYRSASDTPSSDSSPRLPLDGSLSRRAQWLVGTFYVLLIGGLAGHVYWASRVHSRFGLAFTGIVQLTCSSIMSFSVLALLGWNGWGSSRLPTTLPTYILPFVIVIVGAENMSTLTKAVFSIPFTYSVPVRIGLALSKVGTTISFTSLTDIFVLSLVWFFVNLRPVREFCVFAAVVITVDWFMLHTFFLTILSIDAQRLELADVLAAPDGPANANPEDTKAAMEADMSRGFSWRSVLRARSARMSSLVLLLLFVGALYWYTESHRAILSPMADLYGYSPSSGSVSLGPLVSAPFHTSVQALKSLSPAESFWRSLNPLGYARIPVSIPDGSIIITPKVGFEPPSALRKLNVRTSRVLLPKLKPLFYLFKVVILPQAVTLATLWGILMYLLKDTELLDAQRDRLGRGEYDPHESIEMGENGDGHKEARGLKGYMLPCSHNTDVDMIATSQDGRIAISLGLDNGAVLWRFDERGAGTRELVNVDSSTGVILRAAIRDDNRAVVLCTATTIAMYDLPEDGPIKLQQTLTIPDGKSAVGLAFHVPTPSSDDPFISPRASFEDRPAVLLVACADGTVLSIDGDSTRTAIPPSEAPGHSRTIFVRPSSSPRDLHILIATATRPWIYASAGDNWHRTPLGTRTAQDDRVTCADIVALESNAASFIAVGYRSGLIEVFDIHGQHLASAGQHDGPVSSLSLAAPSATMCAACSSKLAEGFYVVAATDKRTDIYRGMQHGVAPCRCTAPPRPSLARSPSSETVLQRTERIPSLVIPPSPSHRSPGASPRHAPSLLPPTGDFPVSSHGRRHSNIHRDDTAPAGPEGTPAQLLSPTAAAGGGGGGSWADIDVHSLGAIDTSQGGSMLVGDTVVGMRRKEKGIDDEGWQIWILDLLNPWNCNALIPRTISLPRLLQTTPPEAVEVGMKDRRAQRLVSLSGRSPFPLARGTKDDLTVPTYPGMAYVHTGPMARLGEEGVMVGLGNRLAMIRLPHHPQHAGAGKKSVTIGIGRVGGMSNGGSLNVTPPPKRLDVSESRKSS